MLYFLRSINSDSTFYLVNKNEFNVGRKDCDFLIEKDASVSRKHAELRIKEAKRDDIVTLKDLGSKYKTFHNGTEITPNIEIQIKCNDKIQFGGLSSIFILKQEKFVTTATKLSSAQRDALNKQLIMLKGQYVDNWNSDCTHLTLQTINLTVKVLQALLDNKPIVLPSFWAQYAANVQKNLPPPDINDYNNPPVGEALLNKVEIRKDICRKELFKNKTFLFFTEKEKKQVDQLIERAGGTAISWDNNPVNIKHITQSTQEFLLMQTNRLIDDKAYDEIVKHFSKKSMRTIPIQEIAMAIIHGSCLKDCNPAFNRASEVFRAKDAGLPTQNQPLVENTQTQSNSHIEYKPNVVHQTVPESLDNEIAPIKKRKPQNVSEKKESTQPDSDNPSKRIKLNNSAEVEEENIEENSLKEMKVIHNVREKSNDNSQASISKRNADIIDNGPFSSKRLKLNSDWCSRVTEQKKSSNETHQENNNNERNLVSQLHKRKPDLPKPFDRNNAFFKIRRSNNDTRDSADMQSSGQPISSDNPFLQDTSNIFSSTQINERTVNQTVYYTKSTGSNLNNVNWISRNSSVNVDHETQEKNSDGFEDEARKRFIDLFKDKLIIVEVMSQLIRSRCSSDEIDYTASSGKNFKKFKKVKPLHPQTTMISRDSFVVQGNGEVTGIHDTRRLLNDSDDETSNKTNNRRRLRTFDF